MRQMSDEFFPQKHTNPPQMNRGIFHSVQNRSSLITHLTPQTSLDISHAAYGCPTPLYSTLFESFLFEN